MAYDNNLKEFKKLFTECVNERNIEIVIIGISQDANSNLAKIVHMKKGCYYYNVLKDIDLD